MRFPVWNFRSIVAVLRLCSSANRTSAHARRNPHPTGWKFRPGGSCQTDPPPGRWVGGVGCPGTAPELCTQLPSRQCTWSESQHLGLGEPGGGDGTWKEAKWSPLGNWASGSLVTGPDAADLMIWPRLFPLFCATVSLSCQVRQVDQISRSKSLYIPLPVALFLFLFFFFFSMAPFQVNTRVALKVIHPYVQKVLVG